jgi:hypothetical protein
MTDLLQGMDQVVCSITTEPLGILKTDHVRELVITEETVQKTPHPLNPIMTVEVLPPVLERPVWVGSV